MIYVNRYDIEKCNVLARVHPKLVSRVTGRSRGPKATSPAWEEAYHVQEVVGMELRRLRSEIAAACEPWFTFNDSDRGANNG